MDNQEIAEQIIREKILEGLRPEQPPTTRRMRPTRIRVNGRFVRLPNGKTLWNQPGHAKSAFTNYLSSIHWYPSYNGHGDYVNVSRDELYRIANGMIERREIEFVELDTEEQHN